MASEKLTNKPITTLTDGYVWTQRNVSGTWVDYRIAISDILNAVTVNTQFAIQREQYAAQTTSFTHSMSADEELEKITFVVNSGSCTVTVGTTPSGMDIISSRSLTTGTKTIRLDKPFATTQTIYFTITGTVNLDANIWYRTGVTA